MCQLRPELRFKLPASVDVVLAHGTAEEAFASVAGSGTVVFARGSVTADGTEDDDGVVVVVVVVVIAAVVVVVAAAAGAVGVAVADVAAGRTGTGARRMSRRDGRRHR